MQQLRFTQIVSNQSQAAQAAAAAKTASSQYSVENVEAEFTSNNGKTSTQLQGDFYAQTGEFSAAFGDNTDIHTLASNLDRLQAAAVYYSAQGYPASDPATMPTGASLLQAFKDGTVTVQKAAEVQGLDFSENATLYTSGDMVDGDNISSSYQSTFNNGQNTLLIEGLGMAPVLISWPK